MLGGVLGGWGGVGLPGYLGGIREVLGEVLDRSVQQTTTKNANVGQKQPSTSVMNVNLIGGNLN